MPGKPITLCYTKCCPTLEPLTREDADAMGFSYRKGSGPETREGWFVLRDDFEGMVILHESQLRFLSSLKELPSSSFDPVTLPSK